MDAKIVGNTNLDELNEEFNNFMYRVTEVNEIVKKLGSTDKKLQDIGSLEADKFLNNKAEEVLENLDEKDVVLKVKSNRTLINKKALIEDKKDESTMSQEAFMTEVSKDAEKRYKDRMIRTERMETFKKQATLAFRRGDFERALSCYNKAIEQIKDSPLLYNNRCLVQIKLQFYDKAIADAETALKLNENCLKSYLFIAKAHYLNQDQNKYNEAIVEAKLRHPNMADFIEEFIEDLTHSGEEIV